MPDKIDLKKEIDFYDDFINYLPGKEIKTYNELKKELKNKKNLKNKNFIFSKYLNKYYDLKLTEPNKKLFKLINIFKLLKSKYDFFIFINKKWSFD